MKKAVIGISGKQYLVTEGEELSIDLTVDKSPKLDVLMTIDGDNVAVGTPVLDAKVTAEVIASDVKSQKVTAIRYKAKKRVHTLRGHRQHHTLIKIKKIT